MLWRVSQRRSQEVLERHRGGDVKTRQGTGLEGGQREAERHSQG